MWFNLEFYIFHDDFLIHINIFLIESEFKGDSIAFAFEYYSTIKPAYSIHSSRWAARKQYFIDEADHFHANSILLNLMGSIFSSWISTRKSLFQLHCKLEVISSDIYFSLFAYIQRRYEKSQMIWLCIHFPTSNMRAFDMNWVLWIE